jgi:hypothetical protein
LAKPAAGIASTHNSKIQVPKLINQAFISKFHVQNSKFLVLNENVPVSSENVHVLNENVFVSSENVPVPNENVLVSSENIRVLNENVLVLRWNDGVLRAIAPAKL